MVHDEYYGDLPDPEVLVAELVKYIGHLKDSMNEDGITEEAKWEMRLASNAARTVREDLARIYEV